MRAPVTFLVGEHLVGVGFGDTGFGGGRVEQFVFRVHDQRGFAGSVLEADVGDEFEAVVAGFVAEEIPGAALGVERPAARLPDFAQFAADKFGDEFLEEFPCRTGRQRLRCDRC
jgi:hypothetical protein